MSQIIHSQPADKVDISLALAIPNLRSFAANQRYGKPLVGVGDVLIRQLYDLFVCFFYCHWIVEGYGLDLGVELVLLRVLDFNIICSGKKP